MRHTLFNVSGELQLFLGDAFNHRGLYLFGGVSGDFERFERSYDDYWDYYSEMDVTRKGRLGSAFGIGHTMYGSSIKFTTELAYHTTLTNKDIARAEPISTDFVRISIGLVF
jgi:hypothetical protein